jgi:hypothetical protein
LEPVVRICLFGQEIGFFNSSQARAIGTNDFEKLYISLVNLTISYRLPKILSISHDIFLWYDMIYQLNADPCWILNSSRAKTIFIILVCTTMTYYIQKLLAQIIQMLAK